MSIIRNVDLVVVGLGVMGAAAAFEAVRRGRAVVGLDRFASPHARGSSHGRSRAHSLFYRQPYLDLAVRARASWLEIERQVRARLFIPCGMLVWDRPVNPDFDATIAAFRKAGLDHALLSPADVKARFPLLSLPAGSRACWMPDAGFLDADLCVAALIEQARTGGAEIVFHQQVARIDLNEAWPLVHTATAVYRCDGLVVTPGPWAGALLQECSWPLTVTRQNVFYFRPRNPERYGPSALPVLGDRISGEYSFPLHDSAIKVAQSAIGPTTDPETPQPEPSPEEGDRLAAWLGQVLPGMVAEPLGGVPCFYTLTPDRGFIVTRHPHHDRVVVGAGFSGHGFKFAPEIARILLDLLCDEREGPDFLTPARFGVGTALPSVV